MLPTYAGLLGPGVLDVLVRATLAARIMDFLRIVGKTA